MIYTSSHPDVDIPSATVTDVVLGPMPWGDARALSDGINGSGYTFEELGTRVQRLASALGQEGVGPGTVVALLAPNSPDFAVVLHAVLVAGGTLTTVNPTYTAEEVRFQLSDSGASWLMCADAALPVAREAMEGTGVRQVVSMGPGDGSARPLDSLDAEPLGQVAVDLVNDVALLPYSSGTTGLPKGVMLTHRNLVANIVQCQKALELTPGESALAFLPFFHIYGMNVVMNALLASGVSLVTLPRFDLQRSLELIQERRLTRLFVVPPVVLALAKHPMVSDYDLSSLTQIISGAAPLGAELAREAEARVGCPVGQGFGMTELSPVTHVCGPKESSHGTSGRLVPNTQARLVDPETQRDSVAGEPGEVWIRGPQVMKGYLNNEEATVAMVDSDGWLRTGDIGIIDLAGNLTIVDRLKELIKVKAFQVAPAELEAVLLGHPAIADAAVTGIPDDEAGETPKAFVVLIEPESLTAEEVKEFVALHVAHYKRLSSVEFVESIPKSPSGKILRRLLR